MAEMEFNWLGGRSSYIMAADGLLDPDLCASAIRVIKTHYESLFTTGPTWGGVRPLVKNSRDWTVEDLALRQTGVKSPTIDQLRMQAQTAMHLAISQYIELNEALWYWPNRNDTGFRLQHYVQGAGFYRTHSDSTPWEPTASGGQNPRVLGCIIYLNTVEVGGGTNFPQHNLVCSAKAGRIALFPAAWTHQHAGMTPLSSEKYILSSFITSSVDKDEHDIPFESELTPLKETVEPDQEEPENDE